MIASNVKPYVIGLMITCNEEWIIKQSLTILLKYVDRVLVLDNSYDNTRGILSDMPGVTTYYQEGFPVNNYGEYRQFLLERGRECGCEYFVCLDADETFSKLFSPDMFIQKVNELPVGWAYQTDIANFYGDMYTYTTKGRIGGKFIDVIFHDDGKMKYENRMIVHEKRTPATDYIKIKEIDGKRIYLHHYGAVSLEKMNNRRIYYMLLEASHNIRSIDSINFDYFVNSCLSNYFNKKNLNVMPWWEVWKEIGDIKHQDDGKHFYAKARKIFDTNWERYCQLNISGSMSPSLIIWRRVVELIRTRDVKVIFKSLRDYIILDVLKKW